MQEADNDADQIAPAVAVVTVRLSEPGWFAAAHRAFDRREALVAEVNGWRARVLRRQLPRLAAASEAVRQKRTLPERENFSLFHSLLLLRFHEVIMFALAHGYSITWRDWGARLDVTFTIDEPSSSSE